MTLVGADVKTPADAPPAWVRDAVFYQIFPDRFARSREPEPADGFYGGDLAGIVGRLDHLERLGVGALYLTPIFAAGTNHRYDTWDYLAVDPRLGSAADLRRLVSDAHGRGIRVVLDGVFNHVGDGFWAFRDVLERQERSRYVDWFHLDGFPVTAEPPNYQTCGGAAFLPKLNFANPEVRAHVLEVAVHWIEQADVDGWRLDVPWKVPLEFWREFRTAVRGAKADAYLVGEAWWSWGRLLDVFDGLMNYRLRGAIAAFCVSDDMDAEDFRIEVELALADAGEAAMLNLLGSHDTPRLLTVAGGDERRALLALAALLTLPGTPMLYYGDEVGLEGGPDPDCRRPMPWQPERQHGTILDTVRQLVELRHRHAALRRGSFEPLLVHNRLFAYRRAAADDEVVVVLNAGWERDAVDLPARSGIWRDRLAGDGYRSDGGRLRVTGVRKHAALVLARERADA